MATRQRNPSRKTKSQAARAAGRPGRGPKGSKSGASTRRSVGRSKAPASTRSTRGSAGASRSASATPRRGRTRIRYAVVGLGHIVQVAVLPAFAHARRNCELVALVSDDATKLAKLGRKYKIPAARQYSYERFDECLASGEIDAVYIGLPNHLHHAFTLRAAAVGVHVLCEKPMALDESECIEMIEACRAGGVRLMIAYRLHFEAANLRAVELLASGELGQPRYFNSSFSMNVTDDDNIRLSGKKGGGPLYDIGIYCINAARALFRAEPEQVSAQLVLGGDPRFAEVEQQLSASMLFPGGRLATFVCSFSATDVAMYEVVGSTGRLRVDPAYEYAEDLRHELTLKGRTREKVFPRRDQFAAELVYFSACVLEGRDPEPGGEEGWADVRVIQALFRSGKEGRVVRLEPFHRDQRPSLEQEIRRPPVERKPQEVHAGAASD